MVILYKMKPRFNHKKIIVKACPIIFAFCRISFGILLIRHGYPKLVNLPGFIDTVDKIGFFLPEILAPMAMISEVLGGILILMGYKIRWASLFVLITMLSAFFVVHADHTFKQKELALTYAFVTLLLISTGSGKYSIDHLIFQRYKTNHINSEEA